MRNALWTICGAVALTLLAIPVLSAGDPVDLEWFNPVGGHVFDDTYRIDADYGICTVKLANGSIWAITYHDVAQYGALGIGAGNGWVHNYVYDYDVDTMMSKTRLR